jgi:hypothetical protein
MSVYADTSVFGGVFDERFAGASRTFLERVRGGVFDLVTSSVGADEVELAPEVVRRVFEEARPFAQIAEITQSALDLQAALAIPRNAVQSGP